MLLAALVLALLVETGLIVWLTWPDHYQPRHLAGARRDELERAVSDPWSRLRHPTPWAKPRRP